MTYWKKKCCGPQCYLSVEYWPASKKVWPPLPYILICRPFCCCCKGNLYISFCPNLSVKPEMNLHHQNKTKVLLFWWKPLLRFYELSRNKRYHTAINTDVTVYYCLNGKLIQIAKQLHLHLLNGFNDLFFICWTSVILTRLLLTLGNLLPYLFLKLVSLPWQFQLGCNIIIIQKKRKTLFDAIEAVRFLFPEALVPNMGNLINPEGSNLVKFITKKTLQGWVFYVWRYLRAQKLGTAVSKGP